MEEYHRLRDIFSKGKDNTHEHQRQMKEIRETLYSANPGMVERYDWLIKQMKKPFARITAGGYCNGCNTWVSLDLPPQVWRLEKVIYHDNSAVECRRILLPNLEREKIPYLITENDVENGEISVPQQLSYLLAKKNTGTKLPVIDPENNRWEVSFSGDRISGLTEVFERYGFEAGDILNFYVIEGKETMLRVFPLEVSVNDLNNVERMLLGCSSLSLDEIVTEVFSRKTRFFNYTVLREKIHLALMNDRRFKKVRERWILARESNFSLVLPSDLENIYVYLKEVRKPVPGSELMSCFLQVLQKDGYCLSAVKLCSEGGTFYKDDRVCIQKDGFPRLAEVKEVFPVQQKIRVSCRGTSSWDDYSVARGKSGSAAQGSVYEIVSKEFIEALGGDRRFVCFNDSWLAAEHLIPLSRDELDKVHAVLTEAMHTDEAGLEIAILTKTIFNLREGHPETEFAEFGISYSLARDKRFLWYMEEGNLFWGIKDVVAPRTSYFTLTETALVNGFIKIRPGMKEMLAASITNESIEFLTNGCYILCVSIDESGRAIYGEALREWFLEHGLKPGDRVFIEAPGKEGQRLQIYSDYEMNTKTKPYAKRINQRLHLRHRIYRLFKENIEFLHIKEIVSRLEKSTGETVSLASVRVLLSRNPHLFVRAGTSRGIWGLKSWNHDSGYRVDPASLLLAISEEDLVYISLRDSEIPFSARELASVIAGIFLVKSDDVLRIQFINSEDSRLLRLRDGRWGLVSWVAEWQQELKNIRLKLSEIRLIQDKITALEQQLVRAEEKRARYTAKIIKLNERIGMLNQKASQMQKEYDDLNGQLETEKTALETHRSRTNKLSIALLLISLSVLIIVRNLKLSGIFTGGLILICLWLLITVKQLNSRKQQVACQHKAAAEVAALRNKEIEAGAAELQRLEKTLGKFNRGYELLDARRANLMQSITELCNQEVLYEKDSLTARENELIRLLASSDLNEGG
jgi:hypothetical protein